MAAKKVTIMVIKVDLSCHKCYQKIKKVLCKIPQIQNQVYDEKANTVTITVVCCSPEKIKKMICCEGGGSVKGIEIKIPEKPEPPKPDKPEPPKLDKPEPPKPDKLEPPPMPDKPEPPPMPEKPEPPNPDKPEPPPACPPRVRTCCMECYEGRGGGPCYHGFGRPPPGYEGYGTPAPAPSPKAPEPVPACPPRVRTCCMECYEGRGGGPCYHGFGRPPPCYEGYGTPAPAPPPKAPEPVRECPPRVRTCCKECYEGRGGGPCYHGFGRPPPCYEGYGTPAQAPPPKAPEPVRACPPPVRTCCKECYEGRGGGPCYHGFGRPPPCYEGHGTPAPPPCYEAYGRPVYDSCDSGGYYSGCRRGCNVGRCDCLSEENPVGCIVM